MKKIINIVVIILILVSMTGCNSKNDYSNNSIKSEKNKKNTQVYYCKQANDGDFELFFNYEDNNLMSLGYSYWYDEEYLEEVKTLANEYNNITYDKVKGETSSGEIRDRLSLTIDFTKDGMTLQESFGMFEKVTDSSWGNLKSIVENNGYTCSLKD